MDSFSAILDDLAATLDVELQEGRTTVELAPGMLDLLGTPPGGRAERGRPKAGSVAAAPDAPAAAAVPEPPVPRPTAAAPDAPMPARLGSLEEIAAQIAQCRRCSLHATRHLTVPGVGRLNPDVLFVGEAPGADEDARGEPFVGRAGQLLTRMIEAMGYRREEVFIANILKCRPPHNRPPLPEEMELCLPFLRAQIALIRPKTIVALGTTAAQALLGTSAKISQLRTCWHAFEGIPLKPTFHPSYLLRNPAAKREAWIDLQDVLRHLGRKPPPRPASKDSSP